MRGTEPTSQLLEHDGGKFFAEAVNDSSRERPIAVGGGFSAAFEGEREPSSRVPFLRVGWDEKPFADAPRYEIIN